MNSIPTDAGAARSSSGLNLPTPKARSRAQSMSSDRPSTITAGLMSPPLTVSPDAAFIAAAAASQIVTNDHDTHHDTWYDQQGIEPPSETVLVSPAALTLINHFLDQLLFNFLSVAKSSSLSALRPAVSEVLKPKLAKDAINQADEELREYLGADDEEYGHAAVSAGSTRGWDLELVWKRTRLRCMVYSSLGDMEEEDEDLFMEQDHLLTGNETAEETISPAVAIFLTSILEFMGEQALVVAGQAAFQRMRSQYEKALREGTRDPIEVADRIVVGDVDVERIALDRTLGRLWRSWKKKMRSPALTQDPMFRTHSRDSTRANSLNNFRWGGLGVEQTIPVMGGAVSPKEIPVETFEQKQAAQPAVGEEALDEQTLAASIPLPMGPDDISEILIPGLAHSSEDEDDVEKNRPTRPRSMMILPYTTNSMDGVDLPTPAQSQPTTPRCVSRKRAISLPTPATSPFSSPPSKRTKVVPPPLEIRGVTEPAPTPTPEVAPETEKVKAEESERPPLQQRRVSSAQISALIAGASGARSPSIPARSPHLPPDADEEAIDEADEIEEFCEEPEILTTSRVSISGRSNSPTTSERSKPAITIGIPQRSASVHSVRMIDLATPRTPLSRSRNSSADAQERASLRNASAARVETTFTPPTRVEALRHTSPSRKAYPFPATKLHQNESISEAEEAPPSASSPSPAVSTPSSGTPTPSEPKPAVGYDELEEQAQSRRPTIYTVPREGAAQLPIRDSPTTKVTIVSSSFSTAPTQAAERQPLGTSTTSSPTKKARDAPHLPERSTMRSKGASRTPSPGQEKPMGMISVGRSSPMGSTPPQSNATPEPIRERQSPPKTVERAVMRRANDSTSTISSVQQHKLKPVRASQDSTRPVDIKTFDELIQSDETIQYTLTPENMRDMTPVGTVRNESPVMRPRSRKGEEKQYADHSRSASTPVAVRSSDIKRSASVSKVSTLRSQTISEGAPLSGPIPRAPGLMPSKSHGAGPQARDARIPMESLSEFADFIRATGPIGGSKVGGGGGAGTSSGRAQGVARGPSAGMGGMGSKASLDSEGRTSITGNSSSNNSRARHQARDAVVDTRDDSRDLIDFIRRGPQTSGNHRIPRTVAPFRTTMDSDQFAAASGGKAIDATLPEIRDSVTSTTMTDNSVPSSINSSSALLRKDRSGNVGGTFDRDEMMPKRKQRRVRDPYAIDLSDEEDDDDFTFDGSAPSRRLQPPMEKEESLAEFLMNVPPPKDTSPAPLAVAAKNQGRQTPKKKSSTTSLLARFTRRDSTRSDKNKADRDGNRLTKQPESRGQVAPQSRAGGGRGYVPIQVNIPSGLTTDYGIPQSTGPKMATSSSRTPMKKFEPREAVSVSNRAMSDLADFLRNSEPPREYGAPSYGGESGQRLPKQFVESGQRLPKQFSQS